MEKQPLYFFNTLSRKKEEFVPLHEGEVRMYNCGPTVYSRATIGNMRSYVLADLLRRTLEYNVYTVQQVINITDVGHLTSDADEGEDKLEQAASTSGETAQEIAQKYTQLFFDDLLKLNINTKDTQFPRATEYIQQQIAMVETLVDIGYGYQTDDGIYFDTAMFKSYGALGQINDQELATARIEKNSQKRNAADFALWKFSKPEEKRQQEWESPWGVGYPGWHIECSAMSRALLGKQLDIHTGGIDHIPIHHNNEIAQSEVVNKKKFVNYWIHNAFITIEGRRIGKSMGNMITLDQFVDRGFSPLTYRYWLLTAHYRTPANFTWEALEGAQAALKRLHRYFVDELTSNAGSVDNEYQTKFQAFVNDDLDMPKAVALVWELVKDNSVAPEDKRATLLNFDTVLGLGLSEASEKMDTLLQGGDTKIELSDIPNDVQKLIDEREKARAEKDFVRSDELREQILETGYIINDTEDGPRLIQT